MSRRRLLPFWLRGPRNWGPVLLSFTGETISEPVPPGTNLAAIEAGVHLLAHPGLISQQEAELAARKKVLLEITSRKGHSLTNGHVARLAQSAGAVMVLNSDTHTPGDIVALEQRKRIVEGAGLNQEALLHMDEAATRLFNQLLATL